MSGDPNDLLTTAEVGAILRCEYRKVLRLLRDTIPAARVEGRLLVRRRDVDAYVAAVTPTPKDRRRGRRRLT